MDPDGKDIVYFNSKGIEYNRIPSKTVFETYVDVKRQVETIHFMPEFDAQGKMKPFIESRIVTSPVKVPMPKIITQKLTTNKDKDGKWIVEKIDKPSYQKYDYQIAATTFLFNQNKLTTQFYDESGRPILMSQNSQIPNIDPTLLKAMAIQESNMGLTSNDIMTINTGGDYPGKSKGGIAGGYKKAYGVIKGVAVEGNASINMAPNFLVTKGFKGGLAGDGTGTWMGGSDNIQAANQYNGFGVPNYKESAQLMLSTSQSPSPTDYNPPAAAIPPPKKKN